MPSPWSDSAASAGLGAVLLGDHGQCLARRVGGDRPHERFGFSVLTSLDQFYGRSDDMRAYLAWHIGIVLTATIASYIAFTWKRRTRRLPLRIRFRSPIAMSWSGTPRASRAAAAPILPPDAPEALTPAPVPVPISFAASTVTTRPWSADQPRPRSAFTEGRYLAWQTLREGWRTWFYLLAFGLIFPVALYLVTMPIAYQRDMTFALPWNGLVALVAGVSVFGLENQRRTYRFLVHHGARPGTVWLDEAGNVVPGAGDHLGANPRDHSRRLERGPAREEGGIAPARLLPSARLRRLAVMRDGDPTRDHGRGHRGGGDAQPWWPRRKP